MKLTDCILFKNTKVDISKIDIFEYPSNYTLLHESEPSHNIGIVLEGKVLVKAYSMGGNNFTLNTIEKGEIYGDILLFCSKYTSFPGSLVTLGNTKIAIIKEESFRKMLFSDSQLLKNFLSLLSDKACEMNYKSKLLSQDSVRDKILYYLFNQKRLQKSSVIKLNITKEELANQLFIQRPSLSRELSRMKKDGLIEYDRKTITIKK